jgi:hypothetical protein
METSSQLFKIVEDGDAFLPFANISMHSPKTLEYDRMDEYYDGIFPRVSDYTRQANKMDSEGVTAFLNWNTPKHKRCSFHNGYCTVTRESEWDNEATLTFDKPIQVVFGYVGEEPVIKEVTQIKGEFFFEWFWLKNGRQDKMANGFEIYFNCKSFA